MKINIIHDKLAGKRPIQVTLDTANYLVSVGEIHNNLTIFLSEEEADALSFKIGSALQDIDKTRKE